MSCVRSVWLGAALGLLLGCSGSYEVGKLGAGGSAALGPGGSGGAFTTGTGVLVGYPGSGGSAASGGSVDAAAGSGTGGEHASLPAYCGDVVPSAHLTTFATPDVVWQRIQLFILDGLVTPQPDLPEVTTRQWAGEQAMIALDVAAQSGGDTEFPAAAGVQRFVSSWLLGAQRPAQWASMFSHSSLHDLLTTDVGLEHGAGVLTDPVLLEKSGQSSRGSYISNYLTCVAITAPASPPLQDSGNGTRRMQVDALVKDKPCSVCHKLIDPFGVSLEHFTPVTGTYSDVDNGLPIDSTGSIQLQHTGLISFADASELGAKLAESCEVTQCMVKRMFEDVQRRVTLPTPGSEDPAAIAEIGLASSLSGHDLRGLIWYFVQSDAFLQAP